MPVLIVATEDDLHTRAVAGEIRGLGEDAVVLDLSRFPTTTRMNLRYTCCGERDYRFDTDDATLDLRDFDAVWWRRPQLPVVSPDIRGQTERLFAANEAQEALAGLWHALDAFWVNNPARDHVAHRKVYQLRVAQEVGLRLPDTLITNDPAEARLFADRHGYQRVIYKAFSALEEAWRETRLLRVEELALLEHVRYAPVIFQEYVEAVCDLRVTIVGDDIFPAAIYAGETEYPVDFRMDMARARMEATTLPDDIQRKLREYMSQLGLVYGAVDMRLRPDGEYVFLEINPAGQWLFVEAVTGQPIAAALARALVEGGREMRVVKETDRLKALIP